MLQGIAITMIFIHLLQFFRLHPTVGTVYVAMKRCITTTLSFLFTYFMITVAFAVGLHFILKLSGETCERNGDTIAYDCKANKTGISNEIAVWCSAVDPKTNATVRVPCSDTCLYTVATYSDDAALWQCDGGTPHLEFVADENRVGRYFGTLGDKINRFTDIYLSLKTLVWSVFEPGHYEVVGCSEGVSRYISLFLLSVYNIATSIVLLNLLVALMGDVMAELAEDKVNSWKYHRTKVWMEYCRRRAILPSPFNLPDVVLNMVLGGYRRRYGIIMFLEHNLMPIFFQFANAEPKRPPTQDQSADPPETRPIRRPAQRAEDQVPERRGRRRHEQKP